MKKLIFMILFISFFSNGNIYSMNIFKYVTKNDLKIAGMLMGTNILFNLCFYFDERRVLYGDHVNNKDIVGTATTMTLIRNAVLSGLVRGMAQTGLYLAFNKK